MKSPFLLLALAAVFPLAAALAGPVVNGNFETAFGTEWTVKNSIPTGATAPPTPTVARVAGTRTDGAGQWVLETASRDHVQDGPLQGSFVTTTLKNTLSAAGNGRTYTTRVWVKLDALAQEASFRCLLRWGDNTGQQSPLILAEAVIVQPGVWVEATATATLTWAGSLTGATIDFEVEQLHKGSSPTPPPQWFPSYQIDDLQMELDGDGDGLWDSEESSDHGQTTISFSDSKDSDGDRMTDDWERAHGLNARDASDATLDPDGDDFSNVQEYFAATDPQSAAQFPGKPSDPLATFQTRALLRYLALRPWRQQALVGQMVEDNANSYTPFITALAAQPVWGRYPAILGLQVEKQNAPLDIVASVDHAIPYANAGGIAQIKWAMWNPWRAHLYVPNQQIGLPGDVTKIDIPGLLDPTGTPTTNNTAVENQAARAVILGWIDTLGTELVRFSAQTNGAPILIRPLSEMNGGWFWWGHRPRAEYLGLWNLIRDRLIGNFGLHNIIWVYESAQTEHMHSGPLASASASDYYYPGDDRVDVMSHNLYDDDWVLPWDANKIYSRYPKIYGVPQAGPGKDTPTSRDGHFDNMNYITQITARYPRMSFFIVWDSFTSHDDDDNDPNTPSNNDDADPLTPDTPTYKNLAIIDSTNPDQLMTDSRVVTRDELAWRPATAFNVAPASSTQAALAWTPAPGDTGTRIEQSADGLTGWTTIATTTPAAAAHTAAGLAPATAAWFRVRALHGADDSLATDPLSATTWSLFQQWKSDALGNFNAPDLADDDGDGLASLLEYSLGANPLADSTAQRPAQGIVNVAGTNYLALTFRRRTGASGVSTLAEATSDLITSPWLPDPVQFGTSADNGDGTETVTFRDIIPLGSAPARFLRLRVTVP
jgi:hypothetical protein